MQIKLGKKFSDREVNSFVENFHNSFKVGEVCNFDLSELEFAGNQELLVFTAVLQLIVESGTPFRIVFFKPGVSTNDIPKRVKQQIIQIWMVWGIWKIIPSNNYIDYFGIDGNSVERLQRDLNYYPNQFEIYNRNGITPFILLNCYKDFDESLIRKEVSEVYKLNRAISELLKLNNCSHPFTSEALSGIITEELYLNYLDHGTSKPFGNKSSKAYMSISFRSKLSEKRYTKKKIQDLNKFNYTTEKIPETHPFFIDSKGSFKNNSYIEFSFLDFGDGIVNTLENQYLKDRSLEQETDRNKILEYAFEAFSSRHPIESFGENRLIPRGLFDALIIVKRYEGMMIVRSQETGIVFDYSNNSERVLPITSEKSNFPGTLISLIIPSIESESNINISVIKPKFKYKWSKETKNYYVDINSVIDSKRGAKDNLYNNLIKDLRVRFSKEAASTFLISLSDSETLDKRLLKKLIYFFLTDLSINELNNVVIFGKPSETLLLEINNEIIALDSVVKNYKVHPLPIIEYNNKKKEIEIEWLGVFNESDKKKLNQILYEDFSLAKSDFIKPYDLEGQVLSFDEYGNLRTTLPNADELTILYNNFNEESINLEFQNLIKKHSCYRSDSKQDLYLANGNYYQFEYLDLSSLINNRTELSKVSKWLFNKIQSLVPSMEDVIFIGITTPSQKIIEEFVRTNIIDYSNTLLFDNYHNFKIRISEGRIDRSKRYFLICDVISTGFLTSRLMTQLSSAGIDLFGIAALCSTLHSEFPSTSELIETFKGRLITLTEIPILKFRKDDEKYKSEIEARGIIRVNPHTNIPIQLSQNSTRYNETIVYHSKLRYDESNSLILFDNTFIENIPSSSLRLGFTNQNNLIHSYYFETDIILQGIEQEFLNDLFKRIGKLNLTKEEVSLIFPRKSGIGKLDFTKINKALNNHALTFVEIDRIGTPEGWKFPNNSSVIRDQIENKSCLIIDDGTCTGESIIQMIDEISLYGVKEIVVVCFIGRINDHKREFFSRVSSLKVKEDKVVSIDCYFVSHWHMPTYYRDTYPNGEEIKRLERVLSIRNCPSELELIIEKVLDQVYPKPLNEYSGYKYLPRSKTKKQEIPIKEIYLVREELGKVLGYRLYHESFEFFNYFMKKYHKKQVSKDRYKEMELLCSVIIYEPYLYPKIKSVLPDIVEYLEEFSRVLLFSNEKINKLLTYEWDKKDVIHLFFIVFKNESLFEELDNVTIAKLFSYCKPNTSAYNYILYKLLEYIPLVEEEVTSCVFDENVKELIKRLIDDETKRSISLIKFNNFIRSLPSRKDFISQLNGLIGLYESQSNKELHVEKRSFNHNVTNLKMAIRKLKNNIENSVDIDEKTLSVVRSSWIEINAFLEPILMFSSSFKEFLEPYPFELLTKLTEGGTNSLRGFVGESQEIIYDFSVTLNSTNKLDKLSENVQWIQSQFEVASTFGTLLKKPYAELNYLINGIKEELKRKNVTVNWSSKEDLSGVVTSIPELYMETVLIKELVTNIVNHSDKNVNIMIENYENNKNSIIITLTNSLNQDDLEKSNGEGLKCINRLAEFEYFDFDYSYSSNEHSFNQELKFKVK